MTEPLDPERLGWWCQACRESHMIHCTEVESCIEVGHMKQLPYSEREKLFNALSRPV